ncbi:hypothetical protein BDM02DRAFT_3126956 [Thelephora ganbajun]|uniref:Uncharacterized protein n=1 Tax=Thelephora ganbajun TaxID=370292 RepID=A0ACB6ZPB5_THEGA|nr:hypothetical protein BDM02DRAFT_3126956 [Thelephora ganbajun]
MTPEVVDSYGRSSYPYVLDSLSSRPASTESKATTTGACFFEVPHANQNDDLMVRPFIVAPNGVAAQTVCYIYEETKCAPVHYLFDIVTPPPSRVGTPVPERTATPFLDERSPKTQLFLLNRRPSLPSVKSHPAPWLRRLRRATIVAFSKQKVAEPDRTTRSLN